MFIIRQSSNGLDCHFTTQNVHHDCILFLILLHKSGHGPRRRDQIWSRTTVRVTKAGHGYTNFHHVRDKYTKIGIYL